LKPGARFPCYSRAMVRVLQVLLFLAPFAAYAFWLTTSRDGGPRWSLVIAAGMALALLIAGLFWFAATDRLPGDQYVPPHLRDGRVVPADALPR